MPVDTSKLNEILLVELPPVGTPPSTYRKEAGNT